MYPERRALPADVHGCAEQERRSVMKIEEPLEERRSCGQRWRLLTYKVLRGPPPSCPEELTASLPGDPAPRAGLLLAQQNRG